MIDFFRVSGAGNDFLALADPPAVPSAAQIRAWCRRGVSLGADGVFLLRPGPQVVMDYYNADGELAALCLNGTRCAARLAFHLGWAEGEVTVLTGAGPVRCRRLDGEEVESELPPPSEPPRAVTLAAAGASWRGWLDTVGVPHLVVPWHGELAACPVAELGAPLRAHPELGPAGANVDFVTFPGPHRLELRTFERGVEAETLACGTGVLAAAAAGFAGQQLVPPVRALTRGGFVLTVDGEVVEGTVRRWTLSGDARVVARGQILPGAEAAPR